MSVVSPGSGEARGGDGGTDVVVVLLHGVTCLRAHLLAQMIRSERDGMARRLVEAFTLSNAVQLLARRGHPLVQQVELPLNLSEVPAQRFDESLELGYVVVSL
jgi:hypothetical protein